jgi:hypothetical protein
LQQEEASLRPSEAPRRAISTALAALALFALGCSGPSLEVLSTDPMTVAPTHPFLSSAGDQLLLDGEPYRFVSLNAFTLTGCGNPEELFDEPALGAFFSSLRPQSLVRTYAFRTVPGEGIDATIRAAVRAGQLLNLVLTDANGSCGDSGVRKDEAWYAEGFRTDYLPWVREIASRYADQPAIGMWELISSPIDVQPATLRAFYDEVGGVVHDLAPNHLVSSGTHGVWAVGGVAGYQLIHESPGIDVAGFRDYDQNLGAPPNLEAALLALAGSKPLILGEAGVYASPQGDAAQVLNGRTCVSWDERRNVMASWIEASRATSLAGIHVWNYLPVARDACGYSTHDTDPLFGLIHDIPAL